MKITIDTNTDSVEEIKQALTMLNSFIQSKGYDSNFIFPNSSPDNDIFPHSKPDNIIPSSTPTDIFSSGPSTNQNSSYVNMFEDNSDQRSSSSNDMFASNSSQNSYGDMFGNSSSSSRTGSSSNDMFANNSNQNSYGNDSSNKSTYEDLLANVSSNRQSTTESFYGSEITDNSTTDMFVEEKPKQQATDIFSMFNNSQPVTNQPVQDSASQILNSLEEEYHEEDDSYNEQPYFKIRTYE